VRHCLWGLTLPLAIAIAGCYWLGSRAIRVPIADNSRCHVCHVNYEDELLATTHAAAGVGCERCHGHSDAHCSDENNITPPDIMYPQDKINTSCMHCHPEAKLAKKDIHKPILAGVADDKKHCTDCHGTHRLARRTVRWDKATGKLLPRTP